MGRHISNISKPDSESPAREKRDLILLCFILGAALLLFLGGKLLLPSASSSVAVSAEGEPVTELSLGQDQELLIEGAGGGSNHLVIRDGKAFLDSASCPDKLCVRQGAVSQPGESIVCLPNQVIITVTGVK